MHIDTYIPIGGSPQQTVPNVCKVPMYYTYVFNAFKLKTPKNTFVRVPRYIGTVLTRFIFPSCFEYILYIYLSVRYDLLNKTITKFRLPNTKAKLTVAVSFLHAVKHLTYLCIITKVKICQHT